MWWSNQACPKFVEIDIKSLLAKHIKECLALKTCCCTFPTEHIFESFVTAGNPFVLFPCMAPDLCVWVGWCVFAPLFCVALSMANMLQTAQNRQAELEATVATLQHQVSVQAVAAATAASQPAVSQPVATEAHPFSRSRSSQTSSETTKII